MNLSFKKIEQHKTWPFAKEIIQKLNHHKFKVFLVGGSVRDLLMKKMPQDFDLVTDAKFDQIKKLFPNALKVGQNFGVLKIVHKNSLIELSSFRKDGPYKDGRHPSFIRYSNQKEDAFRRDFTINSMFYDFTNDLVIDFHSGLKDLKNQLIRSTGSPDKKFKEDYLRILRAFRFVSKLGFEIEEKTFLSLFYLASKIDLISKERIFTEIEKIFIGPFRLKAINHLSLTCIIEILFPFYEIHKFNQDQKRTLTLWNQTRWFLQFSKSSFFSHLFSGFLMNQLKYWEYEKKYTWLNGLSEILNSLKNLKFSNKVLSDIGYILKNHWIHSNDSFSWFISLNHKNGKYLLDLLNYELHFIKSERLLKKWVQKRDFVLKKYNRQIKKTKKLPQPWITGHDLLDLKIPKGEIFSYLLETLYKHQLFGKFKNKKDALKWVLSDGVKDYNLLKKKEKT